MMQWKLTMLQLKKDLKNKAIEWIRKNSCKKHDSSRLLQICQWWTSTPRQQFHASARLSMSYICWNCTQIEAWIGIFGEAEEKRCLCGWSWSQWCRWIQNSMNLSQPFISDILESWRVPDNRRYQIMKGQFYHLPNLCFRYLVCYSSSFFFLLLLFKQNMAFRCPLCIYQTLSKTAMKYHLQQHSNDVTEDHQEPEPSQAVIVPAKPPIFRCEKCPVVLLSKKSLSMHITKAHPSPSTSRYVLACSFFIKPK